MNPEYNEFALSPEQIKSRISVLEKEFPKEKYIWLTPHRVIGGFIDRVFSLTPEILEFDPNPDAGDFYWIDKPKWKCTGKDKSTGKPYEYENRAWPKPNNAGDMIDPGNVAFLAPSLQIIATSGGVNWLPNSTEFGTGRTDPGTDHMIMEFTSGGTLMGLSGMKPITKTSREDLHLERDVIIDNLINDKMPKYEKDKKWPIDGKWIAWSQIPYDPKCELAEKRADAGVLRLRRKLLEKCETKSQNRVVRHMFGIKAKYNPREIDGKKWLILVMRFDPKPADENESRMLMAMMTNTFISAYPGLPAGHIPVDRVLMAGTDERVALPAGDAVDVEPAMNGVDEPVDNGGGGVSAKGENPSVSPQDNVSGTDTTDRESLDGSGKIEPTSPIESGSADLFQDKPGDSVPVDIWNGRTPLYDPDKEPFIKLRHDAFMRLNEIELVKSLSESTLDYNIADDPADIKPLLDSSKYSDLVYANLKLFIYNLEIMKAAKKSGGKK